MRAISASQAAPEDEGPGTSAKPAATASAPAGERAGEAIGTAELVVAGLIIAAALVLHVFYVFRWQIDSDEWQHLHVAWAWTQGMTQYRDVFDNHTPLFHLLTAPLVALFGETSRILYEMRLAMLPFHLVTLWGAYALGRRLFGRRAGLWAVAILGLNPIFFFRSTEYRTDALWVALWMLALVAAAGGALTWRRAGGVGLLLGLLLCASLKTMLLLAALGVAAALLPWATGLPPRALLPPRPGRAIAALAAGLALPPLALVVLFTGLGALGPFFYGAVGHNLLPGLGNWSQPLRPLLFIPALLVVVASAGRLVRTRRPAGGGTRLAFVTLVAGGYLAALHTIWPIFTTYDLLIFHPLLAVLVAGLILPDHAPADRAAAPRRLQAAAAFLLPLIALVEMGLLLRHHPPQKDGTRRETEVLAQVLNLTDAKDLVLDMKGDAIFRRRPIVHVLEAITRARLARGLIPERIQEDVVATRTCVAVAKIDRFPVRTREFLRENFVTVGRLLVAGRFLRATTGDLDPGGRFEIAIPARYALVAEEGALAAVLDGETYSGPRFLDAGPHTFEISRGGGRVALVWAQAIERGFSPFLQAGPAS